MASYTLSHTAQEIDERLSKAGNAVLYTEQTLTEEQQTQARLNIGAATAAEAVVAMTEPQTLTEEQQAQARENIGALANKEVSTTRQTLEVETSTGKVPYINANNKVEYWFSHADAIYGYADVSNVATVWVTGYSWVKASGFYPYWFMDENDTVILKGTDIADSTKFTSVQVTVPAGAKRLGINGRAPSVGKSPSATGAVCVDVLAAVTKISEEMNKVTKLMTLGDSITALGTGSTGWVKYFMEKINCDLVANVAVNGAWLKDKDGTVYDGNPVFNGDDANVNNVLGNQVQKIINNAYEAPDIIIIAIGTNDGISITKNQIKAAYYDSSNALIPLEDVDRTTSAGAYRWCLEKLHETYPNAIIFWCTPIMGVQVTRSAENAMAYAESLRIATEYTGQIMIDTIRCGINGVNEVSGSNGQYLVDGLHPNANGAKKIGYYNAAKVKPYLDCLFELT